jgi:hypothetical protein
LSAAGRDLHVRHDETCAFELHERDQRLKTSGVFGAVASQNHFFTHYQSAKSFISGSTALRTTADASSARTDKQLNGTG